MYRVETHNNSKEYFSQIDIREDCLYVTSNTSLSNMIKEVNTYISKENWWRVVDIENFIKTLYSEWYKPLNQLKLKVEIRKIIIELKNKTTDKHELEELIFLEDNIDTLTKDISIIAETNIKYIKFTKSDNTKLLIKKIYEKVIATDVFKEISRQLLDYSSARVFYKYLQYYTLGEVKKICFYNINNLDLRRYLVIELLKSVGYEIIFKIPYFHDLNVINKCWDQVYNNSTIFYLDHKNNSKANVQSKYISFLEGRVNNEVIKEKVQTKTYVEISDFRKELKNKNVITFYKGSIGSCLDKCRNQVGHCFQSIIGRFLSNLYLVELKEEDVKLDFVTYRELITSGWIEYKTWNGIRFSQYLIDNEDYFNGTHSINEIINRIESIKELEEVNDVFEDKVKLRIKNDDQKKLLSNPFRALAYNNCERYNITANYMYEATLRLKRFMIKALKETDGLINVNDHFELLKLTFINNYIIRHSRESDEFEKAIIKKIWEVLNDTKKLDEKLYKDDLRELFNIKLRMSTKDYIYEEKDFALDQLEGMIIRSSKIEKVNGENIIYLSDLSFKAYEEYIASKYSYGKILRYDDYKDILISSLIGKHKEVVLEGLCFQEKSIQSSEAYVKFCIGNLFINFDGIKFFSWISSLREEDTESIILKQIKSIYGIKEDQVSKELDFNDMVKEDEIKSEKYFDYEKKDLGKGYTKYSEVAFRNLDFCSCKFLYTSILQPHPMYYSSFHQKLVFSEILSILKNSIDDSYKNISQFIFPLFPQWKDVVKSNILTCEYGRKNVREYKYFDGINYPKNIDSLYLLKSKYIVGENWKVKNRYNKGNFKAEEYYKEFIDEYLSNDIYNSGIHCSMCPHIFFCKKGEFLVGTK